MLEKRLIELGCEEFVRRIADRVEVLIELRVVRRMLGEM